MKNKTRFIRVVPAVLMVLALFLLTACGNVGSSSSSNSGSGSGGDTASGKGPTITVGSKNFTEQYILGNMYADALAANGFHAVKKLNLGSVQINDQALQKGQIDLYPEYTGTSLETVLNYKGKTPDTPEKTYQAAKKLYAKRSPSDTMLQPAPYHNTYGIFVTKSAAKKYNLKTLADLAKASPKLTFVSFSEFQNRSDGYPNMKKNYPFKFKKILKVNSIGGPIYRGVQQGDGDVGVGFTTDGQLRSSDFVVMKDPKNIWPYYYPAPVVRADVLKKHPKIQGVLNKVSKTLSVETMRKLNAKVDIDHKDPAEVAKQYLQDQGLFKK
ncbi:MAG: glycine betaine ABC transporter substrate-binding protein [Rubrobacteraceae bacterium]